MESDDYEMVDASRGPNRKDQNASKSSQHNVSHFDSNKLAEKDEASAILQNAASLQPITQDGKIQDAVLLAATSSGSHEADAKCLNIQSDVEGDIADDKTLSATTTPSRFTATLRDPAIKCRCPAGTIRNRNEMVLVGTAGNITWMHLPCKPYLAEMSDERVTKIREKIQSVIPLSTGLSTRIQMQKILFTVLGPNATDAQREKAKNFISKYLCDGPCRGSRDRKDYFSCKQCWIWQHKTCMLYGDDGDHGGPVCNHCYVNFIRVQKEMVAWQKLRLVQAAKAAFEFIQKPGNARDKWRFAWCKNFLGRLLYHNRTYLAKLVVARRRMQYLVRNRQSLTQTGQAPGHRFPSGSAAPPKNTISKAAGKQPASCGNGNRESTLIAASPTLGSDDKMDVDSSYNADGSGVMEVDAENFAVRPKTSAPRSPATRASTRTKARPKLANKVTRPSLPASSAFVSESKAKVKKEKSPLLSDSAPSSSRPMKKNKLSQSQTSKAPWKSVPKAELPAKYNEPQLDPELEDDGKNEKSVLRRKARSSYDDEQPRAATNRGIKRTIQDVEDEEESEEELDIACTCIDTTPTLADSFKCGNCGARSHLKCHRDRFRMPSCASCRLRPQPSQRPSQAHPVPTFKHPSSNMPPPSVARPIKPKREPTAMPAPKLESNTALRIASTPTPISRPLSKEMKNEMHQICSTYLWKTWVDIPILEEYESTKQIFNPEDSPPANWLAEAESRLTAMLEAAGEDVTRSYLSPALSSIPRKSSTILKALRELSIEVVHKGAYKRKGKKTLGVLAEILGMADKGEFWKVKK